MGRQVKLFALCLLLSSGLAAQTTTQTTSQGTTQATTPANESLLIGPGDLLHVLVFDTPELEEHARVTDSGELPLVLGGTVKVAGLTPDEAAHAVEQTLINQHLLLHPRVLINVEQYATENVSIIGQVRSPGAYPIGTPRSVLDVLALAGGLTDMADRKVLIQRHGTLEKIPYLVSNSPETALDTAVEVYPGDTIVVPKAGIVYVIGDVGHPGGYTITDNQNKLSVLQLVARAGGTPPTAVPSHAKLIRKSSEGYVEIALPLSAMQKGKRADMPLMADDIIFVPFSYLRNFVVNSAGIAAAAASAAVYHF